ncbi:MAG: hypothetical protein HQ538_03635 [Parcubacteria group bacterium]|nr:hypothetical protein [Parcubacteria group bacterium]
MRNKIMNIEKLLDEYKISNDEKTFILRSNTALTADMNQSRIVSEFILGKRIEKATDEIIESNEKLSESNKKYTIGMLILTGALVFVGLIQIFCK